MIITWVDNLKNKLLETCDKPLMTATQTQNRTSVVMPSYTYFAIFEQFTPIHQG